MREGGGGGGGEVEGEDEGRAGRTVFLCRMQTNLAHWPSIVGTSFTKMKVFCGRSLFISTDFSNVVLSVDDVPMSTPAVSNANCPNRVRSIFFAIQDTHIVFWDASISTKTVNAAGS